MLTILTQYDHRYSDLADITSPSKRAYADRYGYEFVEVRGFPDSSIPVNWQKIPTLLKALDDSEWVIWTDADSMFMNLEYDIVTLIDQGIGIVAGMHVISYDTKDYVLHGGNILFRSSPLVKDFLSESLDMYGKVRQDRLMEELAYTAVWKRRQEYRKMVKLVKLPILCTIPRHTAYMNDIVGFSYYSPGDFILHFMAPLPYNDRVLLARRYAHVSS